MKWKSTRELNPNNNYEFTDVLLMGPASDGGLIIPETIPQLSDEKINSWKNLSYRDLMFEVISLFCTDDDIPNTTLKNLIDKSYDRFREEEVVKLSEVANKYILELYHGPTFSFKDVALQFIGELYNYVAKTKGSKINVLGATSGDTGSAAIHAIYNNPDLKICILYPYGQVSDIQRKQMTSIMNDNVLMLAINGCFDDCQTIVKTIFNDPELKSGFSLRAVNSINIVRILAQVVYYFYAYFQLPDEAKNKDIIFSVPSGNFGDALAGYYAKKMGLPIKIVVATNENDVLTRFVRDGVYERRAKTASTFSPAMDIQIASNLERYLYDLGNAENVQDWMQKVAKGEAINFSCEQKEKIKKDLMTESASNEACLNKIKEYWKKYNYLMDPHTACGVYAADKLFGDNENTQLVCLSTAHPGKFNEAIVQECEIDQPLPEE